MIVNLCLPNYKIIKNKIIIVKSRVGRRVGGRALSCTAGGKTTWDLPRVHLVRCGKITERAHVLLPHRSTLRDLSLR